MREQCCGKNSIFNSVVCNDCPYIGKYVAMSPKGCASRGIQDALDTAAHTGSALEDKWRSLPKAGNDMDCQRPLPGDNGSVKDCMLSGHCHCSENDEIFRDAARYRWLRARHDKDDDQAFVYGATGKLDEYVDGEMAK